ncbi:hypothetical protein BGZ76_008729 [Entomortierella beljakovae]|nr:hypothetical protein BGZ76_008729 [Entomortierella beljakovae]
MDSIPSPHSFIFSDEYVCQWDSCHKNFEDAEILYEHLKNDHVGRKTLHNLCLTCRWDKCSVPTFTKRDHITSHLRVHVPSKPHQCEVCKKGFKRPQDLKKHEKTHQEGNETSAASGTTTSASGHLQPDNKNSVFPLTPPTTMDRSPSVASATSMSTTLSPYSLPLSPADTLEPWNPDLSSPSYSNNSLFSSPSAPDLDLDLMNSNFDVSNGFYGPFSGTNNFDDLISPSSKRPRDGFDEILSETLGAFAIEAKKKRTDAYNEDMIGRLNALSALLDDNPLTPDRLLSSLPEVTNWDQFDQFNQFCSTLFEDVSGESFEPHSFDIPLFPEYEQKQDPLAIDANYIGIDGFQGYGGVSPSMGLGGGNNIAVDPVYSQIIPDDPPTESELPLYGSTSLEWDTTFGQSSGPGVIRVGQAKHGVQKSRFINERYVSLPALQMGADDMEEKVKLEDQVYEPKITQRDVRDVVSIKTQTNIDGTLMMERPSSNSNKTRSSKTRGVTPDAEALLRTAPNAPDTPLTDDEDEDEDELVATEVPDEPLRSQEVESSEGNAKSRLNTSKLDNRNYVNATPSKPLESLEEMTRKFEQTRISAPPMKPIYKAPKTKPIADGNDDRVMKAAIARSICSDDPIRRQHAEVVLKLLKSIDTLMADHKVKIEQYKATQNKGGYRPVNRVPNQGPIRTVSSYLPRHNTTSHGPNNNTAPHHPSPLQQVHRSDSKNSITAPDYNQLRSSLVDRSQSSTPSSTTRSSNALQKELSGHAFAASDSPVLYPTSDLHHSSVVPFELSEEERRFIEEDNAKTAAAAASTESEYYFV